jgi:hypothetical protein
MKWSLESLDLSESWRACNCFEFPIGKVALGALHEHVVDHALQTHRAAIVGVVNAADAVGMQFLNFGRQNRAAAPAEDLDMPGAALLEQVVHVFEILIVTALVGLVMAMPCTSS